MAESRNLQSRTTIQNLVKDLYKRFKKVNSDIDLAIKSADIVDGSIKLWTNSTKTGDAAFSLDFPSEMFLDQAQTKFVDNFAFVAADYPAGTANPNLDGKPVMVLAVKTVDHAGTETLAYSFVNLAKLVDTYKAKETDKDATTTITVAGYEIEVVVNLSAVAGNLIEKKNDGLYVGVAANTEAAKTVVGKTADGKLEDTAIDAEKILTSDDIADYTEAEIAALFAAEAAADPTPSA